MPPLILGTFLLSLLLLLSAGLGLRLLRWVGVRSDAPAENGLFAVGIGLGSLQFVTFTLFALGIGWPAVFMAVLGVLALLLVPDMTRALVVGWRWLRRPKRLAWWEWGIGGLFAVLIAATYFRALCPITDDDGLSYHLTAAVRLLQHGRFVQLPTLTYTNWPLGVESLFTLLLALHPGAPVGIVQLCFATLTLAAVYLYATRLGGRFAGAAAAVLLLVYKVYWEEAQQAHVDLGTMVFAVLAVLALARSENDAAQAGRWRLLSALFAGLAATTKLNGVWVIVALVFLALLVERRRAPSAGQITWLPTLRVAAGYAAIASCVVLPWFARTWVVTGNPLYPLFYGLFGGKEWTAEGWPRVQRYFLLMNTPPGVPPTQLNLLHARVAMVALALLVFVLVVRTCRRSPLLIPAGFAAGFSTLILLGSGYNLRFLLAAYPSVMVCLAVAFAARDNRARSAPAFCALALFLGLRMAWKGIDPHLRTALRVSSGGMSREEYLRSTLPDYRVVEYANRSLPDHSRILVATWEESTAYYRAFALRPNYWLQDSVHYDSDARLMTDLKRLGVTHIVLRPMDEEWCARSSVCSGRMNTETRALTALAHESGSKLYEADGTTLYAVNLSQRNVASKGQRDIE